MQNRGANNETKIALQVNKTKKKQTLRNLQSRKGKFRGLAIKNLIEVHNSQMLNPHIKLPNTDFDNYVK